MNAAPETGGHQAGSDIPTKHVRCFAKPADLISMGSSTHSHVVFFAAGKVHGGMDVDDKIEGAYTDRNDRPKEDIKIISAKIVE